MRHSLFYTKPEVMTSFQCISNLINGDFNIFLDEVYGAICIETTSSLPVLGEKVNVSYTRDYNEDIHEKIKSKSALLKI